MVLQNTDRNRIDQVIQNLTKNLKDFSEILLSSSEFAGSEASSNAASKGSAASASTEKPKKKKAEKDPNAPKRNLSSYMLYSQSVRSDVVKEHPTVRPVDIAKIIGEKWNALSDKEKQPFVKAAEKEKARYDKETKTYKATLGEPAESTPAKRKAEPIAEPAPEKTEKREKKKSKKASHESSDGKKKSHKKK
ncbi:non-histone chromosomal protein 6 [Mucor ambiguus]|uniref:Non-histone chromosomal protein 6 n=1 Tax=Mucor ambiguus TaxID=91626 RepID=A0A0C9MQL2_9FUNG|nr:non-histone chromosomal protein 6 [Mucor ambiguus]